MTKGGFVPPAAIRHMKMLRGVRIAGLSGSANPVTIQMLQFAPISEMRKLCSAKQNRHRQAWAILGLGVLLQERNTATSNTVSLGGDTPLLMVPPRPQMYTGGTGAGFR